MRNRDSHLEPVCLVGCSVKRASRTRFLLGMAVSNIAGFASYMGPVSCTVSSYGDSFATASAVCPYCLACCYLL